MWMDSESYRCCKTTEYILHPDDMALLVDWSLSSLTNQWIWNTTLHTEILVDVGKPKLALIFLGLIWGHAEKEKFSNNKAHLTQFINLS